MIKEYGYEYDAVLDVELWERTKGKVTYEKFWDALCLRSGRDALKVIAREYEPTTVYLPALACDSMIQPFEVYGHKVVFYRLNQDYTIDMKYLNGIIGQGLFLYMNYFGLDSVKDKELESLKVENPDLFFIEDRTHNLIWDRESAFTADYVVASLRKWISIPDGGLLWANKNLRNNWMTEDTAFSAARLKAQCMRRKFLLNADEKIKKEYREIFSTVSDIIDNDLEPARMSSYAYEIALKTDWDKIREQRKKNAEALIMRLKEADVQFIQSKSGYSDLYVAFRVDDRNEKQKKLSKIGIFNTIIWPLTEKQKDVCKVAKDTEECMLAAPCDQRYSVDDMKFIADEIKKILSND